MGYDAYLAHASDNADAAKDLAEQLRLRGLTVWFNEFIVGPSIREQMEHGLRRSDFGIVLLSPEFFAKKWTRYELDALMGLEGPGEVRILPVWWGTSEAEVRAQSPMLAMRSAAVLGPGGVAGVADTLVKSILSLTAEDTPGKRLRFQIATGFRWMDGPVWMPASFAAYDDTFGTDFAITDLAYYPDVHHAERGQPVPLMELLRAPQFWDGKRITVCALQVPSSVQVLEQLVGDDDLPDDPTRPADGCIAAYGFQLTSVEFRRGELSYVHCIGPYSTSMPGMGPTAPDDDWLCMVTGRLMAFGHMANSRGDRVAAVYLTASSILFMPPVESPTGE